MSNPALKGVDKPKFVCPSCNEATFSTQRELISHALPCKRGEFEEKE